MPKVADIDLPWNRVKQVGPEAIKDADLLAIVLHNGCGGYKALAHSSEWSTPFWQHFGNTSQRELYVVQAFRL